MGQGARVLAVGMALGLGAALLATRALASMPYGVSRFDVWTFVGMSLLLTAVGLLASYVPARRASRVDPVQSMRGG